MGLTLILLQAFITGEEERRVFDDRTAQRGAELVSDELRLPGTVKKISGVQIAVAKVVVRRSVKGVSSAPSDDIHLARRRHPVFGAVRVRRDLEFLNGIDRWLKRVAAIIRIVIVDAVKQEVVVLLASAVGMHREGAARREWRALHGCGGPREQQRELEEIPFIQRKTVHEILVQHCAQFARIFAQRGTFRRDVDPLISDCQRGMKIETRSLIDFHPDRWRRNVRKRGGGRREAVFGRRESIEFVVSGGARLNGAS